MSRDLDYSPDPVPWHQRRRVLRALWIGVVVVLAVPPTFVALIAGLMLRTSFDEAALEAGYHQIEPGMKASEVDRIMGRRGEPGTSFRLEAWWGRQRLGDEETKRITRTAYYRGRGLFARDVVEVTFDADERVVGKRIDN